MDAASAGPPPQREQTPNEQAPPAGLSSSDYARTTSSSPAATSLIPPVRDDPPSPVAAAAPVEPASALATGRIAGLRLVRVEPYSVTRLAFVISVALMIVSVVAVALFWTVLGVLGVWGQINDSVASLLSDDAGTFDVKDYVGFSRVVGGTLVLSGINVILMTALATIGAHLYNLAAALLGGVEATFRDD
jgi:hypothetical protein